MSSSSEKKHQISNLIRLVLHDLGIENSQLFLFGSRARGDAHGDSDWDFLLVTEKSLTMDNKRGIWRAMSRRLALEGCWADLIIKSREQYEKDHFDKGKVTYYACREGIPL